MVNINQFLKEVRIELSKVSWPTKQQTLWYTLVVIGLSAVLAVFLSLLDFGFERILNNFILK